MKMLKFQGGKSLLLFDEKLRQRLQHQSARQSQRRALRSSSLKKSGSDDLLSKTC